jgi:hypothetical protein
MTQPISNCKSFIPLTFQRYLPEHNAHEIHAKHMNQNGIYPSVTYPRSSPCAMPPHMCVIMRLRLYGAMFFDARLWGVIIIKLASRNATINSPSGRCIRMGEHGGVRPYTYLFIIGGRANAYNFDTRGGS